MKVVRALAVLVGVAGVAAVVAPTPAVLAKSASYGEIVKITRALDAWRVDEARTLISALEKAAPGAPETLLVRAQLDFLDGRYAAAVQGLQQIDAPELRGAVKELLPLYTSTRDATQGMVTRTSPSGRFVISWVPGKDEVLVDLTAETLDAQWLALADDLGFQPANQIRVEILPAVADLAKVSTLSEKAIDTSGTIALCKYGKLMVVSPRATLLGYPWRDTLAHELTHYFVSRASDDRVPIWLHEGLAKFEETRWRASAGETGMGRVHEHLLATALKKGRLITFEEMHPSMAYLPSQEAAATAFAEVYAFVAWLQQKVGYAGIRTMLGHIKDGKSERRAVAEAVGTSWEQAEAAWKRYLKTLNLRPDPRLASAEAVKKIRFKKSDGDDENAGVDQVVEERARKHARLGGLLRARGRLAAAAIEYEKAVAIAGTADAYLNHKLARTYLELGQADKAISVLEAVPDRDPDDAGAETTLAGAYLAMGQPERALPHFLAALRVQPFDPAVRCGLAEVYQAQGERALAERELEACRVVRGGAPATSAPMGASGKSK
jgi:tetratricopeptide (TPR) repeat protein